MAISIPSHITGATATSTSTLAGIDASESRSKSCAISGAVATVAASVIAMPSLRPRARGFGRLPLSRSSISSRSGPAQSMIPSTAAKLSCQPTSEPKRGLISRVAAAASNGG